MTYLSQFFECLIDITYTDPVGYIEKERWVNEEGGGIVEGARGEVEGK